jgi:hypothetical protein
VPERDLDKLIAKMSPELQAGEFVFVSAGPSDAPAVEVFASVREREGLSLVVTREDADARGLSYDYVAAWITLTVESAPDAVGLTAAVSGTLADAGISCNVIAGARHDHLLVPVQRAADAMAVLDELQR